MEGAAPASGRRPGNGGNGRRVPHTGQPTERPHTENDVELEEKLAARPSSFDDVLGPVATPPASGETGLDTGGASRYRLLSGGVGKRERHRSSARHARGPAIG
jgi:hypothetical protein